MNVEDVHENRNHHRILAGQRVRSLLNLADPAVDGTQHGLGIGRKFAGRIAEKLHAEDKEDERQKGKEMPVEKPEHGRGGERADDEGTAFAGEEGMRIDSRVQFGLRRELVESALILMKIAGSWAVFDRTRPTAAPQGGRRSKSGRGSRTRKARAYLDSSASTVTLSETSVVPALTAGARLTLARSAFIMGAA